MRTTKLKYKIILSTGFICCSSVSFAFTVTYVNKCNYPIWLKDQVSGAKSINNTKIEANNQSIKDYGSSFSGYAMWAASGCNPDGTNCIVGSLRKNETLFEITVPENPAVSVSSYDISLVDGYTFPMSVTLDSGSLPPTRPASCQNIDASRLDLGQCPNDDSVSQVGPSPINGTIPVDYITQTFFDGSQQVTKDMVALHNIDGIPLQNLRVLNNATGNTIGCISTRSAALGIHNQDVQAWYSCNGYLSEAASICAHGPSHLTKYFTVAKQMAPLAYAFSYEDGLTSVGSYACPKIANYIVTIGNQNNPNSCPNIGQVPTPPVSTKCQAPDLATFKTTKNILDGSSITLNWSTPGGSNVTSYKIFNNQNMQIAEVTTPSFKDNTTPILAAGQQGTYAYRIQSICSSDGTSSEQSGEYLAKVTGEIASTCLAPDITTFNTTKNKPDGSSITVSWAAPSGNNATGYKVFDWQGLPIGGDNNIITAASFTDNSTPSLAVGQQSVPYKYQVQSICGNNTSKLSGVYPVIVTGESDKCLAPDVASFSVMTNTPDASLIKISWAIPNGKSIVSYKVFDWQMQPLKDGDVIAPLYQNQTQYLLPRLAKNQTGNYWYYVQSRCSDGSVSDMSKRYIATVVGR